MMVAAGWSPNYTIHLFGGSLTGFIALYALALNLFIATLATFALRRANLDPGIDRTSPGDYA